MTGCCGHHPPVPGAPRSPGELTLLRSGGAGNACPGEPNGGLADGAAKHPKSEPTGTNCGKGDQLPAGFALHLVLGIDPIIELTDIAGLDRAEAVDVLAWVAATLVQASLANGPAEEEAGAREQAASATARAPMP